MAYLGNSPARSFISFERQVFTIVNSQTAYTLDHSVTNENDIRLVVNNVVQEPGSGKAYTASGTTLTLSAALTNGTDEMYCVFLGRAVGTVNAPAGSVGTSQLASEAVTNAKVASSIITGQTAETTIASDDLILLSDTSASGALKKMTQANFVSGVGGTNTPAFLVQGPTGGQTLSSGTWTKLTDWTNVYDTASGFDFTNDKYTIPSGQGGKYFVYGFVKYAGSASRRIQIAVYKNGTINQAAGNNVDYYAGVHLGVAISLAASDYIEIYCKIDNGGGGQVMTDNLTERFGAYKIIE